jgi:hypothetical protein
MTIKHCTETVIINSRAPFSGGGSMQIKDSRYCCDGIDHRIDGRLQYRVGHQG